MPIAPPEYRVILTKQKPHGFFEMVAKETDSGIAVAPNKISEKAVKNSFFIGIKKGQKDVVLIHCVNAIVKGTGGWWMSIAHYDPAEDELFYKKYGRRPWEELCVHLGKWHGRAGGQIHLNRLFVRHDPPKGFMHPRYADMQPILETPKELFGVKRHYLKPRLTLNVKVGRKNVGRRGPQRR